MAQRRRPRDREGGDTFGGVKKIDAFPKDIARSMFGLPPKRQVATGGTGPYATKDGKPVVKQPGEGESEAQQLKRQENERKATAKAEEKAKAQRKKYRHV